jgi:hypothetical protein
MVPVPEVSGLAVFRTEVAATFSPLLLMAQRDEGPSFAGVVAEAN